MNAIWEVCAQRSNLAYEDFHENWILVKHEKNEAQKSEEKGRKYSSILPATGENFSYYRYIESSNVTAWNKGNKSVWVKPRGTNRNQGLMLFDPNPQNNSK